MADRVYAEINLNALEHNYHLLREKAKRALMASVKADAYGHGAIEVARRLQTIGADWLAVATADEALALREAGITLPVLMLGQAAPERAKELVRGGITLTVSGPEHAAQLSKAAVAGEFTARVHLKLDTGMARLGFGGAEELRRALALPGLEAEGLYTHFATSDTPDDGFAGEQVKRFSEIVGALERKGHAFRYTHCANSGAVLYLGESLPGNLARSGISVYGYAPDGVASVSTAGLRSVMSLWSSVAMLRDVKAGESVGYGRAFNASRDMRIAVLQCGYGDGYFRALSNKGYVSLRGRRCPIVGMVCMDMLMIDVTHVPEAESGDWALMFGQSDGRIPVHGLAQQEVSYQDAVSLDEVAKLAGTISYELLCAVGRRVPRVYR